MSHSGADRLSEAIDRWLTDAGAPDGPLAGVTRVLSDAFPEVSDELARERVRRRLAGFNPRPRTSQQVLLERALEGMERIGHSISNEDDYVPWPTLIGAAAVVVVALAGVAYLRRRESPALLGV
ncbi:MAG: hypothetical protein ACYDGR_11120 [Candidatus Dormibacteria bacterium]